MKNSFLIIIILISFNVAYTQDANNKVSLDDLRINFAVPDLPAFKGMGFEPSNILRPSDIKKLSIIVPQFVENGQAILPKSFALEVSPFLLIKSNQLLTFDEIQNKQFLKSIRISVGTSRDTTVKLPNATKLGLGLRFTALDKSNIEMSSELLKQERELILYPELITEVKLEDEFKKSKGINLADDLTVAQQKEFDEFKEPKIAEMIASNKKKLASLKESFKKLYWNKQKLDFAMSYVLRSSDQFIGNLNFNKLSFWGTYAIPVDKWGQLLIGANSNNSNLFNEKLNTNDNYWDTNINARLYAGSNKFKGYCEYQNTFNEFNITNSNLFFVGGEFNIVDGFWINFYVGVRKKATDASSVFISNFDMKFTLPEK